MIFTIILTAFTWCVYSGCFMDIAHNLIHSLQLLLFVLLQVVFAARLGEYTFGALLRHLMRHLLCVVQLVVVVADESTEDANQYADNYYQSSPERPTEKTFL